MVRLNRRHLFGITFGAAIAGCRVGIDVRAQPGRGETTETPPAQEPPARGGPVDLGTTGGDTSEAFAINDSGHVVGWSYNANEDPRGFHWDGSTLIELESLGGQESEANGINSSGLIVGSAISSDENRYAVQFDGPLAVSLGTLGGGRSVALGVNDDGLIVGYSTDANDIDVAFLFINGGMTALSAFPASEPESRANAIGPTGEIVGYSINASGRVRPAKWLNGAIQDVSAFSPDEGIALAINGAGQIVGQYINPDGIAQAVLWQPDGEVVPLLTEEGFGSEATSISLDGVICGNLIDADDRRYAVRWIDSVLERLPTLGGPRSAAWAINTAGQIVGSSRTGPDGEDASVTHATLWTFG